MSRRLSLLPEIHIASPCPAEWAEMRGDDRRRFCETCGKHVHNFAELREAEILDILRGESVCAQLFRRADGTILTADCPIGARLARSRVGRSALRVAGFLAAMLGTAVCAVAGPRVATIDRLSRALLRHSQSDRESLRAVSGGIVATPPPTTAPATRPTLGEISAIRGEVAATPRKG